MKQVLFILSLLISFPCLAMKAEHAAMIREIRQNFTGLFPEAELELWQRIQIAVLENDRGLSGLDLYRQIELPEPMKRHLMRMSESVPLHSVHRSHPFQAQAKEVRARLSSMLERKVAISAYDFLEISADFVDVVSMIQHPAEAKERTSFEFIQSLFHQGTVPFLNPTTDPLDYWHLIVSSALGIGELGITDQALTPADGLSFTPKKFLKHDVEHALVLQKTNAQNQFEDFFPAHFGETEKALDNLLARSRYIVRIAEFRNRFPVGQIRTLMDAVLFLPVHEFGQKFSNSRLRAYFTPEGLDEWQLLMRRAHKRMVNPMDMELGFESRPTRIQILAAYRHWQGFLNGSPVKASSGSLTAFICNGLLMRSQK